MAQPSRATPTDKASDHNSSAASHATPRPHPTANPTMTGKVRITRLPASDRPGALSPSSISPMSVAARVTLVVITVVDGTPYNEICTRTFYHHCRNAEQPAVIPLVALESIRGCVVTSATGTHTGVRALAAGHRGRQPTFFSPAASNTAALIVGTNTGTERIFATC